MAQVELIMPKMGESITEATILKWLKQVGDTVEVDESILEIATDKVDSEVPSPAAGVLTKILFQEDETVEVNKVIAIISTEGEASAPVKAAPAVDTTPDPEPVTAAAEVETAVATATVAAPVKVASNGNGRFYSPLVLNIAREESIAMAELETLPGTGRNDRVTKKDILAYVKQRKSGGAAAQPATKTMAQPTTAAAPVSVSGGDEIIEMDRMRKLIADHMVMSKATSAHVTSFVEADVTNIVLWRNKIKNQFQQREGEKITFTPIFVEAVCKVMKDFPWVNASVDGHKVIVRKNMNIGMAAAMPNGNLIVPVIHNADQLSLIGLTKKVNDLAGRARSNKLKPEEIQGGTFTLTNVGTFGNLMGTPIINQPQVAILATGAIKKKPVVIETPTGDTIGIRHMMFLSMSYDHRIVDGAMGGSFIQKMKEALENWDMDREI